MVTRREVVSALACVSGLTTLGMPVAAAQTSSRRPDLRLQTRDKLVMIGDSITDVGRARLIGEGRAEDALGRGYVMMSSTSFCHRALRSRVVFPLTPMLMTRIRRSGYTAPNSASTILAFAVCFLYLARTYHRQTYIYLPILKSLYEAKRELREYYEASGIPADEAAEEFTENLEKRIRSSLLYRSRIVRFVIRVLTALAALPFVADQVRK